MIAITDEVRKSVAAELEAQETADAAKLHKLFVEALESNWNLMAGVNKDLADGPAGLIFTKGVFEGIQHVLAFIRAETGVYIEQGGDRRRALEERVRALEARMPAGAGFQVAGVEDQIKISALEDRIKQLEAKPAAEWRGVWRHGSTYHECSVVTHDGGLWIAKRATMARPGSTKSGGSGETEWRLIVKSWRPT